jgi:hypothetical protein
MEDKGMNKLFILKPVGKRKVKFNEFFFDSDGRINRRDLQYESPNEYQVLEPIPVEMPEWATSFKYCFDTSRGYTLTEEISLKDPSKKYRWKTTICGKEFVSELMTEEEFTKWMDNQIAIATFKSAWQKVEE